MDSYQGGRYFGPFRKKALACEQSANNFRERCLDGQGKEMQCFDVILDKHNGFLVAFEGIDGAGKTTQARQLQSALQDRGFRVLLTKEPTSGRYGQILRDSAMTGRLSVEAEVEMFMKDRQEHVHGKIFPSLAEGCVVIVDRYYFSTAAYQGCRGLSPDEILARNESFAPEPDLLLVLDVDPIVGLDRIRKRGDHANHFEKVGTLEKARAIFLSVKRPYKVVVDASQSAETVKGIILNEFLTRYRGGINCESAIEQVQLTT